MFERSSASKQSPRHGALTGLVFLIVLGFGPVFAPALSAASNLTRQQVESLIAGARVPFTSSRGNPGYWYFRPDGRFRGEIESPMGAVMDDGRWWVELNGLLCREYESWRGGQASCVFLRPEGQRYRTVAPDGSVRDHVWSIEK